MSSYRYIPDWYAIKYNLAAMNANEWVRLRNQAAAAQGMLPPPSPEASPSPQSGEVERSRVEERRSTAEEHAVELATTCAQTLYELGARWWRRPLIALRRTLVSGRMERRGLRIYLEDAMQPTTLVLLAGVSRQDIAEKRTLMSEHDLLLALRDRYLDRRTLVDYVEARPRHAPRVDYNLACLYAEWQDRDTARERLRVALARTPIRQRYGLAERAVRDPTLAGVVDANDGTVLLHKLDLEGEAQRDKPD